MVKDEFAFTEPFSHKVQAARLAAQTADLPAAFAQRSRDKGPSTGPGARNKDQESLGNAGVEGNVERAAMARGSKNALAEGKIGNDIASVIKI